MRFVWVDAGNDPDFNKGTRHRINGYFMPMFDARTTKPTMQAIKDRGFVAGIYIGHGWFAPISPKDLVAKVAAEYKRVQVPDLRVMFNLEQHDPEYIARVLELWRKGHKTVGTSWSPEGMQGGWMTGDFPNRVVATKTRVVPQCFVGNMERRESDMVLRDLLKMGFPHTSISMFYDAAQLGDGWDGYAFTQGRLP
jgi:hypothetical protein